jgi:hypothetical protein
LTINKKLTVALLATSLLGGSLDVARAEAAKSAYSFLRFQSVVTHVNDAQESYTDPQGVANNLSYLGFTMVGDGPTGRSSSLAAFDPIMAIPGMRLVMLTPYTMNSVQTDVIAKADAIINRWGPTSLAYIRGYNEPNNFGCTYGGPGGGTARGQSDYTPCAAGMKAIHAAVKADSLLSNVRVSGIAEPGAATTDVGTQFTIIPSGHTGSSFPPGTQFSDVIDVHGYSNHTDQFEYPQADVSGANLGQNSNLNANHGPSVWSCGCYGGYALNQLAGVPKIVSEWGTESQQHEAGRAAVSQAIQGKIAIDGYLDFFQQGWEMAQYYQLRDQAGSSSDQQHDGLFTANGTAKLAATYIHNQNTILADTGAIASPGTLSNTVNGGDSLTHSVLMQKSDGTYWWAVWRESLSGSVKVTLNFGAAATGIQTFDPTVATTGISKPDGSSLAVTVTDHPVIVKFSIGAAPPAAGEGLTHPDRARLQPRQRDHLDGRQRDHLGRRLQPPAHDQHRQRAPGREGQ